jgi:hypothetical protein
MLDLNSESVLHIAEKAREFQTEEIALPQEPPTMPIDDRAIEYVAEWAGDPAYLDLKDAIDDLEPDQQVSLVALMWLGRGDYELSEWAEALEYAEEARTTSSAEYLIATPLLADYLLEGLNKHGYEEE